MQFERIPKALRELPQWTCWKLEANSDGKETKVPYRADMPARAKSTDPRTWTSFEKAWEALAGSNGLNGVCFVVSESDPIVGVDLDDSVDESGLLHPDAAAVVALLDSYTEFSPSGRGVRILLRGEKPGPRCKLNKTPWGGKAEVYDRARVFTVTGNHMPGTPTEVEERRVALENLYAAWFPPEPEPVKRDPLPVGLDDRELLERMFGSRNGERIRRLWAGDTNGHQSDDSSADLALCSHLAFWTGRDPQRMDSLFRSSGLMRPKWDERRGETTYGAMTIDKAIAGCRETYDGNGRAPDAVSRVTTGLAQTGGFPGTTPSSGTWEDDDEYDEPPLVMPPFPLHAIPSQIADLARAASRSLSAPPEFVAVPALVVCASAIGTSRRLEVKGGHPQFCNLMVAIVGDPGTAKSPGLGFAREPADRIAAHFAAQYEYEMTEYRQKKAEYDVAERAWKNQAAKGILTDLPDPVLEPRLKKLVTTDSTWEALAANLAHNRRGIVYIADEITGWVRSFDQYRGRGADRTHWLSAWSMNPIQIDRKTGDPISIQHPFVNVVGGLPPDVLDDFCDSRGRSDGFIDRILFVYPETVISGFCEEGVPRDVRDAYGQLVERLWEINPAADGSPVVLEFTPAGWREFVRIMHEEMDPALRMAPMELRGPYTKLSAYVARFSLLLHMCRVVNGEASPEGVDEVSVGNAIELIRYFRVYTQRAHRWFTNTDHERRHERLRHWLAERGGEASLREIRRGRVLGRANAAEVMEFLASAPYGRIEERQTAAGRVTNYFVLS